jgi:hypothetical protein
MSTSIEMPYRPSWTPSLVFYSPHCSNDLNTLQRHTTKCVRDIDIPAERASLTQAQAPELLHMHDLQDVRPKNALLCLVFV